MLSESREFIKNRICLDISRVKMVHTSHILMINNNKHLKKMEHVLDTIDSALLIYSSKQHSKVSATIVQIFTEEEARAQNSSNWLKATR